ncbi:hypothetical protein VTG60DRAFT_6716 [Thermothelomyces hinnuleus]
METNKVSRTLRYHTKVRSGFLTCKHKPALRRLSFRSDNAADIPDLRPGRSLSAVWTFCVPRRSFQYFQSQAFIALGSAYEAFEAGSSDRETPLTLQQRNLAIRQLASLDRAPESSEEEVTFCTLTASVLFIYLASIRGRFLEAFQHIRSSAKILQDFDRSTRHHPDATTRAASPAYLVPISRLRSLLASAYAQLRSMVNDVFLDKSSVDILVSDLKPATVFTSLQEAYTYVKRLHQNTLAFLQASEIELEPQSGQALKAVVARYRELCQALESN